MITTNAESDSKIASASGYYLEIISEDNTRSLSEINAYKSLIIKAQAGEQYSVISSRVDELSDHIVVTRTNEDLEVRFYNGMHLIIKDYYLVCSDDQCGIRLPDQCPSLGLETLTDNQTKAADTVVSTDKNGDILTYRRCVYSCDVNSKKTTEK